MKQEIDQQILLEANGGIDVSVAVDWISSWAEPLRIIGGIDCTIDRAVDTSNCLEVPERIAHNMSIPDSCGSCDGGVEGAPLAWCDSKVVLVGISGRGSCSGEG